jgi:4-carboxymuconolactone decarboxylase
MSRVPDLDPAEFTPRQRELHGAIAGARGGVVRGPFAIWLRTPGIAEKANQFGNELRLSGRLDKRLFELMVLVVARHWSAQYEWYVHEKAALEAGVSAAIVAAIRDRAQPQFAHADEHMVFDLVTELNETKTVSDKTYARALDAFGLDLLIELVTAAGFYTLVAMMLNAFDAPVPGGLRPLAETTP